jgi:hypothetical protein
MTRARVGVLAVSGVVGAAVPALAAACAITDGTHSYGNLQTALNAAHSGDTLHVSAPGDSDQPAGGGSSWLMRVCVSHCSYRLGRQPRSQTSSR